MEMEEILNECRAIVEEACQKYGYDAQDKPGNDSLKTVLLRAIPSILKDYKKEDRELFYQMLSHTPIVITENLTQESYDKLLEQYIGKDINQHIIEESADFGEYGKKVSPGAYVSEAILDENMNLQGKKSFIYISRVSGKAKEFYGTDINVSHLIHELGHAWNAEKEQFSMQEDGTLKERVGTAEYIYSFSKTQDSKYVKKCIKAAGLMLEEAMNTISEEIAMANYMGNSLEEMKKAYNKPPLLPNNYQGYITYFVSYMLEKLDKEDFKNYRLYGETESKDKINSLMSNTEYWMNRETDILPSSGSPRNYDKKKAVIGGIDNTKVQDYLAQYENIYFPDISTMTPLDKIDNILEQIYCLNMNMMKFIMGFDNYVALRERIDDEGYPLINQAAELVNSKKQQDLLEMPKEISPFQAIRSALKSATIDKVHEAIRIEVSERNPDQKQGETKND